MKIKFKEIIFALFILVFLSNFNLPVTAITVGTDNTNDVGKVTYTDGLLASYSTGSRPEVDIISVDYTKEISGNVTLKVTFSAAPVIDNQHWYAIGIGVDADTSGFTGLASAGTITGSNFDPLEAGSVTGVDDTFIFSTSYTASEIVQGNSLVFTFQINADYGSDYTYPDNPSDKNWIFSVTAMYGLELTIAIEGDLYVDYYPDSENLYDFDNTGNAGNSQQDTTSVPGGNNPGASTTPGFESSTAFFTVASFTVVYKLKKRRNVK